MPLPYHPIPGTIVVCDYDAGGFRAPEMTKRRLAVIISPKLKRRDALVTVVPLSTTEPVPLCDWHCPLLISLLPPWGEVPRWAKCDMVATVSYKRLNLPYSKHAVTGKRQFAQIELAAADVRRLRECIAKALGLTIAT